jgi:hypothetical protein
VVVGKVQHRFGIGSTDRLPVKGADASAISDQFCSFHIQDLLEKY